MSDNDPPAAILTNAQREYIQGKKDYRPSTAEKTDRRIQKRIEYGLFDLRLLFEYLDQEELRKSFGLDFAPKIERHQEARGEISTVSITRGYVPGAIAFFLRGLNHGEEQIYPRLENHGKSQPAFSAFAENIEQGIGLYLREETNYTANVSVTIELNGITHKDEFLQELEENK